MSFKRQNTRNHYLHDTRVENMFINEYMVGAPGEYVKVYLYGLMYADLVMPLENEMIAKELSMEVEEVLMAWNYWEKHKVIKKYYADSKDKFHYEVEFLELKEILYGSKTAKKQKTEVPENLKKMMDNDTTRTMFAEIERMTGRLFTGTEPARVLRWISDYGVEPEAVMYAYSYCIKTRGKSESRYVGAVLKEWADKGYKTKAEIENYLAESDGRHYQYKRIMKALGFMRNATEEEKRIMDTWFDDHRLGLETVLDACKKTSGISNPNINYVNSVLTGRKDGGSSKAGSSGNSASVPRSKIDVVKALYEEQRMKNEALHRQRCEEVYGKIPQIATMDDQIRELGFDISKMMLSGRVDAKKRMNEIQTKIAALNEEKVYLLEEHNYSLDYMDLKYSCEKCKDTGTLDSGERCECFERKLAEI